MDYKISFKDVLIFGLIFSSGLFAGVYGIPRIFSYLEKKEEEKIEKLSKELVKELEKRGLLDKLEKYGERSE